MSAPDWTLPAAVGFLAGGLATWALVGFLVWVRGDEEPVELGSAEAFIAHTDDELAARRRRRA